MGTMLLYALTLQNINRFSNLFHCQYQEKICNNTITKDPTTPEECRYTTVWNVSVSLIAPLVSGVAGLSASSSSKADTLNIDIKTAGCDSYFRNNWDNESVVSCC